jgi:phosphatidylserine/phosphatidylglycerophosphate/cardiolipin synthase-like enzyme
MPEANAHTNPNTLDLGMLRTPDGYFLARDAPQRPFAPSQPGENSDWAFGSTFRNSPTTLRDQVLTLIREAQHKVFVTSFILGDDDLAKALVSAADRLTGGVYVISELSEQSLRRGLARLADNDNVNDKVEVEKKRFLSLTTRGVAMRGHTNCHAKFVVVDDNVAWVGSANLETGAFTTVGEVGVVTHDPLEVDRLARLFARMWLAGCQYELPSTAHAYAIDDRTPTAARFAVTEAEPGPRPALVWTDDTGHTLLTALHDVIDSAHTRLILASFSLNRMAERPDLLIEPVARAIERGVHVNLLLRAMNKRDRHRHDAAQLHQLGVRVLADDHNHAKAAVADNRAGVLFSANFDAEHGLDPGSGIEIGARLDGTTALLELTRYLDHALTCATREYVHQPTARQMHDRLDERWQHPWPWGDHIRVQAEPNTWARLTAAAHDGPVLWRKEPGQPLELLAGIQRFHLQSVNNNIHHLQTCPEANQDSSDLINDWWRRPSEHRYNHGYCPAILHRE